MAENMKENAFKPAKTKLHWSRRTKKPYNHTKNFKKEPIEKNIVFIDNSPDFEVSYLTTKIGDLIPLFHHIPGQLQNF